MHRQTDTHLWEILESYGINSSVIKRHGRAANVFIYLLYPKISELLEKKGPLMLTEVTDDLKGKFEVAYHYIHGLLIGTLQSSDTIRRVHGIKYIKLEDAVRKLHPKFTTLQFEKKRVDKTTK